jgi:uncharacterized protein (TIGR02996 family)
VTDEDALLRAVIAEPDDDAPRLIYADWLDEHGDSERAEFIRVQIALVGMLKNDARRPELQRHQRRLLRRCGPIWAEPLRPLVRQYAFRRGFVESIVCYANEFVIRGEDLFSIAPIRHLWLPNAGYCALQVSQCSSLNRPLSLQLCHNSLGDRDIYHLANSPFFGRLSSLDLARNRITGVGARYLARSPYLGSLDDLYLKGNEIPREGRTDLRRRFGTRVHF